LYYGEKSIDITSEQNVFNTPLVGGAQC